MESAANMSSDPSSHCSVHMATKAVCTVFAIITVLFGTVGNCLVIQSLTQRSKLKKGLNCFVLNMSLCDFVLSFVITPVFLYAVFNYSPENDIVYSVFVFVGSVCAIASLLTLVSIAVYRESRIRGIIKRLTSRKVIIVLSFLWMFTVGISVSGAVLYWINCHDTSTLCNLSHFHDHELTHNDFSVFILYVLCPVCIVSLLVISVSYLVVACVVNKHPSVPRNELFDVQSRHYNIVRNTHRIYKLSRNHKLIDDKHLMKNVTDNPMKNVSDTPVKPQSSNRDVTKRYTQPPPSNSSRIQSLNKAVVMCFVVCVTVLICWSPFVISQIIQLVIDTHKTIICQVKTFGISLILLNSALNPFVYYQHKYEMLNKFIQIFRRTKSKPAQFSSLRTSGGTSETECKNSIRQLKVGVSPHKLREMKPMLKSNV